MHFCKEFLPFERFGDQGVFEFLDKLPHLEPIGPLSRRTNRPSDNKPLIDVGLDLFQGIEYRGGHFSSSGIARTSAAIQAWLAIRTCRRLPSSSDWVKLKTPPCSMTGLLTLRVSSRVPSLMVRECVG